jgi:FKBP-type peptidyl-prolyl cis-trans isomerase FklB
VKKRSSIALILAGCLALLAARAQQPSTSQQSSPAKSQKPEAAQATPPAAQSQDSSLFKSQTEKISYAIGMNLARSLSNNSVEVDLGALEQGFKDALAGGKTLLTVPELQATLAQVQADIRKKQQEKMQQLAETNKMEGEAFLNANKSKDGVVVLPSGLQYKILQEGTGPKPTPGDSVTCNYRGTLVDGTEFDSSYKHGAPAEFAIARVIKGWIEALQLMPTGSKWQIFIPSGLAYGERGSGPTIGPNATLIYEVELLSVQSKPEAQPEPKPEPEPKTNPTPNLNPHSSPSPNPN